MKRAPNLCTIKIVDPGSCDRVVNISFILNAARVAAPLHSRAKLQAAMFLVELHLKEQGLCGPRFTFVQSRKGPFSKELQASLEELQTRGFVDRKDLNLTERGEFLSDLILPELRAVPENEAIFATADSTLKRCQPETGDSLSEKMSCLTLRPQGEPEAVKLKDCPPDKVLIVPAGGRLKVAQDLAIAFVQEFDLPEEQIAKAENDWPEIESRALERLRRAVTGGQPS